MIPMSLGYEGNALYFHTAREGRKLDILRKNNLVCFELDTDVEIIAAEDAAGWGARYCCVIGFGTASLVDDPVEKRKAHDSIMRHYAARTFSYPDLCIGCSMIIRVDIDSVTGKRSV